MLGESVPSHTIHWVNNSRDESTRTSTWKQKTINTELLLLIFFPPPTLRLSSVFSKCVLLFEFFFSKKSSSSKKNFTTLRGVGKNICRACLWNNKNTLKAATFLHRKQSRKHSTTRRSLAVLLLPCSRPLFPPPPELRRLSYILSALHNSQTSLRVTFERSFLPRATKRRRLCECWGRTNTIEASADDDDDVEGEPSAQKDEMRWGKCWVSCVVFTMCCWRAHI